MIAQTDTTTTRAATLAKREARAIAANHTRTRAAARRAKSARIFLAFAFA